MLNELERNEESVEQIIGLKLSNEKRERLKKYTISVLGEDYYNLTLNFFKSIWEEPARYEAFMSGRCLNLMYTFYQIEYSNLSENVGKTIYSDTALLANAKEIAADYKKYNFFSRIIIVDDILVHGRTISVLLQSLQNLYMTS